MTSRQHQHWVPIECLRNRSFLVMGPSLGSNSTWAQLGFELFWSARAKHFEKAQAQSRLGFIFLRRVKKFDFFKSKIQRLIIAQAGITWAQTYLCCRARHITNPFLFFAVKRGKILTTTYSLILVFLFSAWHFYYSECFKKDNKTYHK